MLLSPIPLIPAFRAGALTPWGGDKLRTLYGKDIPGIPTGESMELSVIPGFESTDAQGRTLSELIDLYGETLLGKSVRGEFPLLIKLIDANNTLSVQVHPDNVYARIHENKSGKTEAWVILHAEPGAQIICGLNQNVTRSVLAYALENNQPLSPLLRAVTVHTGDVFYLSSGTVHAIGCGIVLYEIQQSSDITYRLYDWDRTDTQGNKRPLHIQNALDVIEFGSVSNTAQSIVIPDSACRRELVINSPYFSVQRLQNCLCVPFYPNETHFSVLTALSDGEILLHNLEKMPLSAGQTVLIPACCYYFSLSGASFLLAAPQV